MKTITVDYEHNCEKWWDAAREEAKGNPPTACVGLLDSVDTLTVSDEDAKEFLEWAARIPGFDEQPFVINTPQKTYGDLMDYSTAKTIRPATQAERDASRTAAESDGGAGVIRPRGD